jgi:curved DNA-binding protein CbpA
MTSKASKPMTNYYLTLDIMPGSSQNEILHAYNRAKMTYSSGSLASYSLLEETNNDSIVQEIERAFEILGSPSKRREYDLQMGFNTWSEDESAAKQAAPGPSMTVNRQNHQAQQYAQQSSHHSAHQNGQNHPKPEALRDEDMTDPLSSPPIEFREKVVEMRNSRSGNHEKAATVAETPASSQFEPNLEFEKQIKACTELEGAFVRAVRVYRNLSVEQLANISKIAPGRITAIEDEDTSEHNQAVYLRGHVAIVARTLELPNPENLSKTYIARLRAQGKLPSDRI